MTQSPAAWPPTWLTPVTDEQLAIGTGDLYIDFIEQFCVQTRDTVAGRFGEPLVLREWQKSLIQHLYAHTDKDNQKHRTALVGMARKNGKSALGSGIALSSLFLGPAGGEVLSAAADREQARIVFGTAKSMIEQSPELMEHVKLYRDAIEVVSTKSVYRVLSSEAFTKEGLSPHLVIFDELHASPTDELYNVLQLGSAARRNPLLLAISTAGTQTDSTGQESICFRLYQYGQKVARGEVDDPSFFMAWWEAPQKANHHDLEVWRTANPGFGDLNDPADFESSVKRTPEAEFRTKRCNQWVSAQFAWLPHGSWDALTVERELDPEVPIVLGFDGSFSGDATVLVGATVEAQPHIFLVRAWEKQPHDPIDWRVDSQEVEYEIFDFCSRYKVIEVACDPYRWQRSMQALEDRGLPIVEYASTSPARMVPACAKFYDSVSQATLTHARDPLLARHLSNCVIKNDRLGPRIVKEHKTSIRKIDAAVAAVIAFDRATSIRQVETPVPMFFDV
jgi:phage terminase large subunit-like protein